MKLSSYVVAHPEKGICKQFCVWGISQNNMRPLIYLQRPKWIKDDVVWDTITKSISLQLPDGFDVK